MVLSLERWIGKVAIVTGTSSGIGATVAEALVEKGIHVVGLARRVERVEELSQKLAAKAGKLYPFKADITKEDDILKAFEWTKKNLGPISILVNNAGRGSNSLINNFKREEWRDILDLNVLALCTATREAVNSMKENNIDGHIIHINSIYGHRVPNAPGAHIYAASKYAVTALTESMRAEFASTGSKVKVTSISPGLLKTEIWEASGFEEKRIEYVKSLSALDTSDVADAVVYVLSTPPHVQVHELLLQPIGQI